jgi:hypothetical protein
MPKVYSVREFDLLSENARASEVDERFGPGNEPKAFSAALEPELSIE